MKKIAFDGLTMAMKSIETESSYQKFCNFLASELEKIKEKRGEDAADRVQRKLNMCLLNELDELQNSTVRNLSVRGKQNPLISMIIRL